MTTITQIMIARAKVEKKMAGVSGVPSSLAQTLNAIKSKVDSCLKELNSGEGASVEEKDGAGLLSTLEKALGDLSELQCSQKV